MSLRQIRYRVGCEPLAAAGDAVSSVLREGAMGNPVALARSLTTIICAPSVIASMSGMDVGDAATFAPTASETP